MSKFDLELFKQQLRNAIEQGKEDFFTEGYEATDEETLGILLSKFFSWDGLAILKTAEYALEDANFHTESGVVADLAKAVEEL